MDFLKLESLTKNFSNLQIAAGIVGGILVIKLTSSIARAIVAGSKARKLQRVCDEKRRIRDQKINNSQKYLSELNISEDRKTKILTATASELVRGLKGGELTSLEILLTFYQRAITVGKSLENLADVNIDYAYQKAKEYDSKRAELLRSGKSLDSLGVFCGLPISLKDCFVVEGLDATGGCAINCLKPYGYDGLIVETLKREGLIPFIQSNIPQGMMINESVSRVWGRAKNPYNLGRTTGGSSGGEAGLISSCCSPIGIGSDVGGSLRIPSLYCGIYSFKPGAERTTYLGTFEPGSTNMRDGNIFIRPSAGPLAKSVEDLNLMMNVLLSQHVLESDVKLPPLPWKDDIVKESAKRRIGYVVSDPFFEASPANKRAVLEAVRALRDAGHECVEVSLPNMSESCRVFLGVFTASPLATWMERAVGDEKPIAEYKSLISFSKIPGFVKKFAMFAMNLFGKKRIAKILKCNGPMTVPQVWENSIVQQVMKDDIYDLFREKHLDAIISPLGLPALKHGESENLWLSVCYTFYWNVVNLPTGCVPVTFVAENEQTYSDTHNDLFTADAKKSAIDSKGLPVGVQVSTLPFKEELCLNIMGELERQIKFNCSKL